MDLVETLFGLFIGFLMLCVVGIFVLLGADFFMTAKNGIGWVGQDRNLTAIQELKREEGGCVYYVDVWGREGKNCGSYSIELN